jgi:Tfp pilus assembly ATPase PilU
MKQSLEHGMQTFDESLYDLYARPDRLRPSSHRANADSRTDLSLRIRLHRPSRGGVTSSSAFVDSRIRGSDE